ncbi:EAL domain-containing protein [Neptunomonas concharum]|uniref:cyclic-guanylate-specific phosphodiesterase n=1 Tax=Neptunomonas concharum TaxID=1031538 RepID=A0A5P1R8I7_9GAMM|nr:EAL domain-containing protein [Neptunomonas concharum]
MRLPKWTRPLVCLFFFSTLSQEGIAVDVSYGRTILVINSYHQGFPWSDGILKGVDQRFTELGIPVDLQIEYLDTKRFSPEKMFPLVANVLKEKDIQHVDAILATDNNALSFAIKYRSALFGNIPLVFVGVNNFSPEIIEGEPSVTGIAEVTDPVANFKLIKHMHPDMERLLLVSDATPSGMAEQQRFAQHAEQYAQDFVVETYSSWTVSELKARLAKLTDDTIVFRLPLHKDKEGLTMTLQESVGILLENSPVPVYSAWDTAIAQGAVGGFVATSTLQGKFAADYLIEILKGRPISELPVMAQSPSEPVFNGRSMEKYGLDPKALPSNAVILNPVKKPHYSDYLLVILGLLLFSLLWFVYLWRLNQRRLGNLSDQFSHVVDESTLLTTLMDSNSDHIYAKALDGKYLACNQSFADFIGAPKEDVVGCMADSFFPAELVEVIDEQDKWVFSKGEEITRESWVKGAKDRMALIECIKTPLRNNSGRLIGLLAVNRDITRRYYENEQLRQNSKVLDMLIRGVPLTPILEEIAAGLEKVYPDCLCSILLMDKERQHLVHGAAPSLPDFYIDAINGVEIGDGVGSCGTAAWKKELVIVEDIDTHPYWKDYKSLAKQAGLASCWSQPVMGTGNDILGTFAFYQRKPSSPTYEHLAMIEQSARLVSLALERKQVEEELNKLSRAVEQSPTMVIITDALGIIEYVNEEFSDVTGYQLSEVRGLTPAILNAGETEGAFYKDMWETIKSGHDWHGEMRNKTKSGQIYWSMLSISPILNEQGEITHFIGVSEDISSQKKTQEQIEQLAFYDPLTRLGNRRLFREQLEFELKKAKRNDSIFALFYLDLDNFKQVNDTLGHDVGDRLLQALADRIRQTLRHSDLIARLGGDEFIALLPDVSGPKEAGVVAEKLLAAICQPLQLGGSEIEATVSLGVTMAPTDGEDWPVLMKNADLAMYRAKRKGRNNYQFFTREMNEEVLNRVNMEHQLRNALERQEFCLHYQPQWTIMSELQPVCLEALIRWNHPERGRVSPAEFIPIAEDLGLIVELGEWVLNQACLQGKQLIDSGHHIRIAVNLSMRQFFDPELLNKISAALAKHQFPASLLELEITESMIMEDVETVIETLQELKKLGVSLAIDDFGTGYSSLSYLKRLPFDHLKVDASFVRDIPHDKNDMEITAAVIAMAHKLGLKVVAEGIETHDQLAFLRENSCEMGQGFLLAKPASMEDIMRLIDVEFDYHID